MLHLFRTAVNPKLGLQRSIENWPSISLDLRECARKRTLQTQILEEKYFKMQTPAP